MNSFSNRPKILVTNDDGIFAEGIRLLWEALVPFADLTVSAPSLEQSSTSLSVTVRTPLSIEQNPAFLPSPAYAIGGTPVDAVKFALSRLYREGPPDLIVSGVNLGENHGQNVFYSGTVGAVIEGALRGIPGIAFSCFRANAFSKIKDLIVEITQETLRSPLRKGTFLNVNFPDTPEFSGVRYTRQGRERFMENPEIKLNPGNRPYFWMGKQRSKDEEPPESDSVLLREGFVTITPLHLFNFTDEEALENASCGRKG